MADEVSVLRPNSLLLDVCCCSCCTSAGHARVYECPNTYAPGLQPHTHPLRAAVSLVPSACAAAVPVAEQRPSVTVGKGRRWHLKASTKLYC